jgi:hypothetical protein
MAPLDYSRVTTAGPLVTLAMFKEHVHNASLSDADLQQKLSAAEAEIVAMCGAAIDPTWTATTVPKPIQQAILYLAGHYNVDRGDDPDGKESGTSDAQVRTALMYMLSYHRDPPLG